MDVFVGQLPLLIVQAKLFIPAPRLVTEVVALLTEAIVPLPPVSDQLPTPIDGEFPANTALGELMQITWLVPATAALGRLNTRRLIVELLVAQTLLLMLHFSTLSPAPRLVTVVAALVGLKMAAVPEITVQLPVPDEGMLAESCAVGELMQRVWLGPALAFVGVGFTTIRIVLLSAVLLQTRPAETFLL